MHKADYIDLGRMGYGEAHELQLELLGQRMRGECGDTLLLVEHPHVITLGRRREALAHVLAPGDVPVIEVERGGDVTYHGPGQLVAYPILQLATGERDLHKFLRNLEQAVIMTLARHGMAGGRVDGKTGVWLDGSRKIASIGIACRKWITFHGLALNVNTDLAYFQRIEPCGFQPDVMTSIEAELGRPLDLGAIKRQLALDLGSTLGRAFARATSR